MRLIFIRANTDWHSFIIVSANDYHMTTDMNAGEQPLPCGDGDELPSEVVLIPIRVRLPKARIDQIDHKVKVERTHTTRAGFCRDAVIAALDAVPERDLTEDMIEEIESGRLDAALKDRIRKLMFTGLQ